MFRWTKKSDARSQHPQGRSATLPRCNAIGEGRGLVKEAEKGKSLSRSSLKLEGDRANSTAASLKARFAFFTRGGWRTLSFSRGSLSSQQSSGAHSRTASPQSRPTELSFRPEMRSGERSDGLEEAVTPTNAQATAMQVNESIDDDLTPICDDRSSIVQLVLPESSKNEIEEVPMNKEVIPTKESMLSLVLKGKKHKNTDHGLPASIQKTEAGQSLLRAARAGNVAKVRDLISSNVDLNTVNSNGLNALHLGAKEGHLPLVQELLDRGADIGARTKKRNSALHIASFAGKLEIVRLLVERNADVNAKSQNGFTPLYMSAQEGYFSIVEYLLKNGANSSLATDDGFTPLAIALQQGHERVVSLLLEREADSKGRLPALHIAVKMDDVPAVNQLLSSKDVNVNHTSMNGFTPLHIAAHYGNLNVAKVLVENKADVNYKAKNNITPLHVAAKWGQPVLVEYLINEGAEFESFTRDGLTPLHCAARSGHVETINSLLKQGSNINVKTKNGLTPLHLTARYDHGDAGRILLKGGASPDAVSVDMLTPLHVAAHCGNESISHALFDARCDVNARAFNGFTPLHVACKKMRTNMVELLLKNGAAIEAPTQTGLTPLHVSCFVGNSEMVKKLLCVGANINQTTLSNETPLHLAVQGRHLETMNVLIDSGAQLNAKAKENQTPLHLAVRTKDTEIVRVLLKAGVEVNSEARGRYTPLALATKTGSIDIVKLLLDHGANINLKTKRGHTPLHIASKAGNIELVGLLLKDPKTNINVAANNGLTPLHISAHYGFKEVVKELLAHGANANVPSKNGFTALHLAVRENHSDVAEILLKAGAPPDSRSKNGFTALHIAAQEGNVDIISCLVDQFKATVSKQANNGLSPLHLSAQSEHVEVSEFLLKRGAPIDAQTISGSTPLHEACFYGKFALASLLISSFKKKAKLALVEALSSRTKLGSTPLHVAAQQGHLKLVNLLIASGANPNTRNLQGWTAAQIAKRQNYPKVFEVLSKKTDLEIPSFEGISLNGLANGSQEFLDGTMDLEIPTHFEDKLLMESDDESIFGTDMPSRSASFQMMRKLMDYSGSHKDDKEEHYQIREDPLKDDKEVVKRTKVETSLLPVKSEGQVASTTPAGSSDWDFDTENVYTVRKPVKAGFLVSFLVDARGGFVEAQRRPEFRFLIPPNASLGPLRIICRMLRPNRVKTLPYLNDGDAFACRIIEMSPIHVAFTSPILLEVPFFASLCGDKRELITLRSDNGDIWKAHLMEATDHAVQEALGNAFEELETLSEMRRRRIQHLLTTDFPQFFALISRPRQDVARMGPDGGIITSTVAPRVQAIFPKDALMKKIRVALQVQVVSHEVVQDLLGAGFAFSPLLTIEPRRRKFHKPITVILPLPVTPKASSEQTSLRLLCSITSGTGPTTWEDITESTSLTPQNDSVAFTTIVSARLWLVEAPSVPGVTEAASLVYRESIIPPYMGHFAVYARLPQALEAGISRTLPSQADAELRCLCQIDEVGDKSLENQERFQLVASGPPVELYESGVYRIEMSGDISPFPDHVDKLRIEVQAFRENRLTFPVRVRKQVANPTGQLAFMYDRRGATMISRAAVATLQIRLPTAGTWQEDEVDHQQTKWDVERLSADVNKDWQALAQEIGMTREDIDMVANEPLRKVEEDVNTEVERCLDMCSLWQQRSAAQNVSPCISMGINIARALVKIGRKDAIQPPFIEAITIPTDEISPQLGIPAIVLDTTEELSISPEKLLSDEDRDLAFETSKLSTVSAEERQIGPDDLIVASESRRAKPAKKDAAIKHLNSLEWQQTLEEIVSTLGFDDDTELVSIQKSDETEFEHNVVEKTEILHLITKSKIIPEFKETDVPSEKEHLTETVLPSTVKQTTEEDFDELKNFEYDSSFPLSLQTDLEVVQGRPEDLAEVTERDLSEYSLHKTPLSPDWKEAVDEVIKIHEVDESILPAFEITSEVLQDRVAEGGLREYAVDTPCFETFKEAHENSRYFITLSAPE